jgi:hypothetical protein
LRGGYTMRCKGGASGARLDEKQMLPGDDIYEQVDRGIRLLCFSQHSLTSWWRTMRLIVRLPRNRN